MKASNLQYKSNLFVWNDGESKYSSRFLAQVSDANTLVYIKNSMRKRTGSDDVPAFLPWQREFANHGLSCCVGKEIDDEHTHGIISEAGEKKCVCKCQHKECKQYHGCSSRDDFREIVLDYTRQSPPSPKTKPEKDPLGFEYYGDVKPPEVVKIPKPSIATITPKHIVNPISSYTHWIDEWDVRGHYRTLQDGTQTWVRPHKRGAQSEGWVHPDVYVGDYVAPDASVQIDGKSPTVVAPITPWSEYTDVVFEDADAVNDCVLKNLVSIDDANCIIKAPIEERIFVNGAAGTGKTYTVLERLKYILKNSLAMPDTILVLCFSRSAVKVIRNRLKEEIQAGRLDYDALDIGIRTFDSFATWYLKETVENVNFQFDDYDERIKRFNKRFKQNPQELNDALQYLIVDETQDLVGLRAEMVQGLIDKLSCGFMLLGDQCQAIYDYQIKDDSELNAARFFAWLDSRFDAALKRYELTKNYRQKTALQTEIVPLRDAMLKHGIARQKKELGRLIDKYRVQDMTADDIIRCCSGQRAILSWSNGDAYKQSQDLYSKKNAIDHVLLGNSRKNSFTKKLAILLSEYQERTIARNTFLELARKKDIEQSVATKLWDALSKFDDKTPGFIDLSRARQQMLWEANVEDELISTNDSSVTVSTIHKAKGKEYDEVLVNLSKLNAKAGKNDAAEIKVYYVALTRAKTDIVVKENKPEYAEKTRTGRYLKCTEKVVRYEFGLDGDIDVYGFVSRKIFGSDTKVRDNQEYIRTQVKRGDRVAVWRQGDTYRILHNGRAIGCMNDSAFEKYKKLFPRSGKSFTHDLHKYNRFEDIYISDIITIVNKGVHEDIAEPYSQSGFWLGIDFCGYSKPMEE
jgi:hypothetical protein